MDELADRYPPLNAGELCLDFANTLEPSVGEGRDHLASRGRALDFAGLVAWARYANLDAEATQLVAAAAGQRRAVVEQAVRLREAVSAVFTAVATGRSIPGTGLDEVRRAYAAAVDRAHLAPGEDAIVWDWASAPNLAGPLGPIAASAVDLLTGDRLGRVKVCRGDPCDVLFVDGTKNRSRRWCQMRYCGNVLKSSRQAARRRAARTGARP